MFPEFFCHPADANERVEWGRAEIGWQNRYRLRNSGNCSDGRPWRRARSRISTAVQPSASRCPPAGKHAVEGDANAGASEPIAGSAAAWSPWTQACQG